jgi:hypothetical protein
MTTNTVLSISNNDEKTPLHYLLENPDAERIIKAINDRKMKATAFGGAYKVEDFFSKGFTYKNAELELVKALGKGEKRVIKNPLA